MHYQELSDLLAQAAQPVKLRYTELYRILCAVLLEETAGNRMDFSGSFARLTYLMEQRKIPQRLRLRLNALRGRCQNVDEYENESLEQCLPADIASLVMFLEALHERQAPEGLRHELSYRQTEIFLPKIPRKDYLRVCVVQVDAEYITAVCDMPENDGAEEKQTIRICYTDPENRMGDWAYLQKLMSEGNQLNLLKCQVKDGVFFPEVIVLEPDCLVDVSRLARCFAECGPSAYNHLLNLLQPQPHSGAILMGNMAGMLLDRELGRGEGEEAGYSECAREFMQHYALDILSCKDGFSDFHKEALAQQKHIHNALDTLQKEEERFDRNRVLLEPTFFCETLGLQGRMDLLQDDLAVLLEQKAGKREFATEAHREPHYVQMLLYQAILHYGFGKKNDHISSFLLYSRFEDGLIKEGPAPKLLFEAMKLRNQMVWLQFSMARCGSAILDKLQPEHFNTRNSTGKLWTNFLFPQIAQTLNALRMNDQPVKAYVHRMLTFVAREHLLAKIGAPGREASGLSSLWNCSLHEKIVAGSIFCNLTPQPLSADATKAEELCFECNAEPVAEGMPLLYLPNFRVGDAVLLYRYCEGVVPDVRKSIVFRAGVLEVQPRLLRLRLRNPQSNTFFFAPDAQYRWAVEKDTTESSFVSLYRSVYSILQTTPERRALLLGQREPRVDAGIELKGDYSLGGSAPHFNNLVLGARQAQDFFLLVGPPGTGKTSFGMKNILLEELKNSKEGVLLVSYTNRAIDEICSKLVEEGLDFLRISSPNACAPAYQSYLFSERVKDCSSISEIKEMLLHTDIVVGTTTSLTNALSLFELRSFGLAIIDEASQILEPHLLGLLCACHKGKEAIHRFVMIGDHKQLPAVVQQDECESQVSEEVLQEAGLCDCRESLFQRLLRLHDHPSHVFRFTHQGRMHPEVAQFANEAFYGGELHPVPLPHQQKELCFNVVDRTQPLQALLARNRVVFLPTSQPEQRTLPKANHVEAEIIAQAAKAVYDLYRLNGRPFLPDESLGIIVPYRHQIALVGSLLQTLEIPELQYLTIDTVERFQGSQRDVIIFGFTVQQPYQLDFLCAQTFCEKGVLIDRKLNVALTRAKEQLVLIGNPDLLQRNPLLAALIRFLTDNGKVYG